MVHYKTLLHEWNGWKTISVNDGRWKSNLMSIITINFFPYVAKLAIIKLILAFCITNNNNSLTIIIIIIIIIDFIL